MNSPPSFVQQRQFGTLLVDHLQMSLSGIGGMIYPAVNCLIYSCKIPPLSDDIFNNINNAGQITLIMLAHVSSRVSLCILNKLAALVNHQTIAVKIWPAVSPQLSPTLPDCSPIFASDSSDAVKIVQIPLNASDEDIRIKLC